MKWGVWLTIAVIAAVSAALWFVWQQVSAGIAVENASPLPVYDVELTLEAAGVVWTEEIKQLASGKMTTFRYLESDVYVEGLSYRQNGKEYVSDPSGLATPGEVFVLTIRSGGKVDGKYSTN